MHGDKSVFGSVRDSTGGMNQKLVEYSEMEIDRRRIFQSGFLRITLNMPLHNCYIVSSEAIK